jgi:SAM-dependent methyltransferase
MKEYEIRPKKLFDDYLELLQKDSLHFFGDDELFKEVDCLACGSKKWERALEKDGFSYNNCLNCGSLYLSPRPPESAINHYYQKGESVKFWSESFYRETAEARRVKIYRPRADRIGSLFRKNPQWNTEQFVDIGAGYGLFLEEITKLNIFTNIVGIEPAPNMASACRSRGLFIHETPVEKVNVEKVSADFATSFEVFEHIHSPENFLKSVRKILKPRGLFLFTTLTIDGFDLQVLWDKSKTISPPLHINFFSKRGFRSLLEKCGFSLIEISTPGQLDVDIVLNASKEYKNLKLPRFVRHLIDVAGEDARGAFQTFLRDNLLSSHVMVIAQKI